MVQSMFEYIVQYVVQYIVWMIFGEYIQTILEESGSGFHPVFRFGPSAKSLQLSRTVTDDDDDDADT